MKSINIIVEARMNSKRLPGKHMLKVRNMPILQFLIMRLKLVKKINKIIIATTDTEKDQVLVNLAKKNKVNYYRGSEKNVMDRVLKASNKYKTDIIVGITADCPLVDPNLVSQCIDIFLNNNCDYLNNLVFPGFPQGMNCQVYKSSILKKSYKLVNKIEDYEHVTSHILRNSKLFKHLYLAPPSNMYYPKLRYELDEKKDYIKIKKIIESFSKNNYEFTCLDIINKN